MGGSAAHDRRFRGAPFGWRANPSPPIKTKWPFAPLFLLSGDNLVIKRRWRISDGNAGPLFSTLVMTNIRRLGRGYRCKLRARKTFLAGQGSGRQAPQHRPCWTFSRKSLGWTGHVEHWGPRLAPKHQNLQSQIYFVGMAGAGPFSGRCSPIGSGFVARTAGAPLGVVGAVRDCRSQGGQAPARDLPTARPMQEIVANSIAKQRPDHESCSPWFSALGVGAFRHRHLRAFISLSHRTAHRTKIGTSASRSGRPRRTCCA